MNWLNVCEDIETSLFRLQETDKKEEIREFFLDMVNDFYDGIKRYNLTSEEAVYKLFQYLKKQNTGLHEHDDFYLFLKEINISVKWLFAKETQDSLDTNLSVNSIDRNKLKRL